MPVLVTSATGAALAESRRPGLQSFQQSGWELGQRSLEEAFLIWRWLLWRRGWLGVLCLLRFWLGLGLGLGWRFGHLRELPCTGDQA